MRQHIAEDIVGESLSGAFFDWITASLFLVALTIGTGKALLGISSGYLWLGISVVTGLILKKRFASYSFND